MKQSESTQHYSTNSYLGKCNSMSFISFLTLKALRALLDWSVRWLSRQYCLGAGLRISGSPTKRLSVMDETHKGRDLNSQSEVSAPWSCSIPLTVNCVAQASLSLSVLPFKSIFHLNPFVFKERTDFLTNQELLSFYPKVWVTEIHIDSSPSSQLWRSRIPTVEEVWTESAAQNKYWEQGDLCSQWGHAAHLQQHHLLNFNGFQLAFLRKFNKKHYDTLHS